MNSESREVVFTPLGERAAALPNETVLDAARRAGVPLGNSCGGVGICARCRVRIVRGGENLSAPTSIEVRTMTARSFASDERLACMAVVEGECEVTTGYW